ncbi:Acyl-CoA synthetase (AMP-forming)/AMP-acid ligase II [Geosmithia morbida]|uniref:Acyl-CoA synthetase (AMP-forming)/AMP-acid ligase II n=1 Tax=Geosmithia morbida TaxID=1094350 RepID=A0A9P4Z036_9HYPO|nr:Acyl-CoA synthetase (AMP-forming)/AMP-acid ligase II [Geosmithia morbida]KAF4124959.1 Acyl-CoA synthetase (AMP-forming)/AMP-acid ligase II [Geosmithia morbida]
MTTLPRLPILEAIASHRPDSTAVVHSLSGRSFTYSELLADVGRARDRLRSARGGVDMDGERVAFLLENSYDYVVTLLAVMASRSIAVPLSPAFPAPELQYILNQSEPSLLVSSAKFASKARQTLAGELVSPPTHVEMPKHVGGADSPDEHHPVTWDTRGPGEAGVMLYTSGTTNRPKGVLLPQSALTAQSRSLMQAWDYSPHDRLLHVLPLHHIHGIVNAVLTPLLSGASVEFLFPFNADAVWSRLAAPFLPSEDKTPTAVAAAKAPPVTFFTVVPTVYSRLMTTHKLLPDDVRAAASAAVSPANMRLAISGSAALPTPVKKAWRDLSGGSVLLERYGMTEVGMALSCGLDPGDRIDASVGWPLPSVQARLVDVDTGAVIAPGDEVDPSTGRERSGEIQLRGPTIFKEYWRNPEATASEFVPDPDGQGSWFRTGDVAVRRPVPEAARAQPDWTVGPMYFIQGRKSADIIKTGGEKVSALEVERELLSLPQVAEAAVVSVPSGKWGHKVGCVVVLDPENLPGRDWSPLDMRRALKPSLAGYKIPQVMRVVDGIPRNAMGKINKKQLVADIFKDDFSGDEM